MRDCSREIFNAQGTHFFEIARECFDNDETYRILPILLLGLYHFDSKKKPRFKGHVARHHRLGGLTDAKQSEGPNRYLNLPRLLRKLDFLALFDGGGLNRGQAAMKNDCRANLTQMSLIAPRVGLL